MRPLTILGRALPLLFVWLLAGVQLMTAQPSASPAQLTFSATYVGIASGAQSVTFTNMTSGPVYLDALSTTANSAIVATNCLLYSGTSPVPLAPGASCSASLQFTPTVVGAETGSMTLFYHPPLNGAADSTFTVPLSGTGLFPLAVSTTQLNFGNVLDNYPSFPPPSLPVTITNHGGLPLVLTATNSNPLFAIEYGTCSPLTEGASCTFPIWFTPRVSGPQTGTATVTGTNPHNPAQVFTLPAIALSGTGHSIIVQPSVSFPLTLLGNPPSIMYAGISNFSSAAATISRITVSGSAFTADVSACVGTLTAGVGSPGSFCYVRVTFTPTIAAALTGALTIYDDDTLNPQVIALSGSATAMKFVGPDPSSQPAANFNPQPLLTTSTSQNFTLTNTGSVPLNLQGIQAGGDYARSTNCKSPLAASASCTISVSFEPTVDGFRPANLTVTAADPASPKQAPLSGLGIGIGQAKITLHYDYMVASDHTHDPEATAPGAIARIVQTFAMHGIELVIDPHHTAIPEVPVITFTEGIPTELCAPEQMNFYTLRNQYFSPKSPQQHYTLFAHNSTNHDLGCVTGTTGYSEVPGLNFVVTMGDLQSLVPADLFASVVGNTFMHELGHNLGLHHGGGFGGGDSVSCGPVYCYSTDIVNYKPNYLSVMNYSFQFSGVPQADAVGSTNLKSCVVDPECGISQSCITYYSSATVTKRACYRQDYSTQQLPTDGNTPGTLDETNLDETAGLGSGTVDISDFLAITQQGLVDAFIPTTGPVDWDYDGATDERHLALPIDLSWDFISGDFSPKRLKGWDDWGGLLGTAPLGTSSVQTLSTIAAGATGAALQEPELDFKTAAAHHILFPLRPAPVVIQPDCQAQSKPVPAGAPGTFLVALLATDDFDPTMVDLTSLNFHGAKPVSATLGDVNGDGVPDLVIEIRSSDVRLSRNATRARLTGWLQNSQAFVGEEKVVMVADALRAIAACQ